MKFRTLIILIIIFLLYSLCSCSNTKIPPSFFAPKDSLSQSVDPNTVSSEYLARLEKYDKILALSPIPVYIISSEEFATRIFLKMNSDAHFEKIRKTNILGMYFYGSKLDDLPEEFIFINKSLTPEQIMVTYFHEIGHYYHRLNKCEGCLESSITRETHAIYNELKLGWEYDLPHVLESSIRTMAIYATHKDANMSYKMATFKVMETDLWKNTMSYLILLEKGL